MANSSNIKRQQFTENQRKFLHDETLGVCPVCGKSFCYTKKGRLYFSFDIAHIYPLNPSQEEIEILKNVKFEYSVNSFENLIALCPSCHRKYDNPRTQEEYYKLLSIKKRLLNNYKMKELYSEFTLEEELSEIVQLISSCDLNQELEQLSFSLLTIDEKTKENCSNILKITIKRNVVYYFNYIRNLFIEIDKLNPNKFNIISAQIKCFYIKCLDINSDKDWLFEKMIEWLQYKTNFKNRVACEIIISFFVQNCEVFS